MREWRVLGLLGYLVPAELCELLERLDGFGGLVGLVGVPCPLRSYANFWSVWKGFGGFEAWQTAALNAYKKPLLRPAMAQGHAIAAAGRCPCVWRVLEGLVRLVGVPCPCGAMRTFGAFGGFWSVWRV